MSEARNREASWNMVFSQGDRRCKNPLSQKRANQPRPEITVKIHKMVIEIETLVKTYHEIDAFQFIHHYIFLLLPSPFFGVLMARLTMPSILTKPSFGVLTARLPNPNKTRMTQADDTHEMVDEVPGWPPAEVLVVQVATASLKNPVVWHIISGVGRGGGLLDVGRGGGFLLLDVGPEGGSRWHCSRSQRWRGMGKKWECR